MKPSAGLPWERDLCTADSVHRARFARLCQVVSGWFLASLSSAPAADLAIGVPWRVGTDSPETLQSATLELGPFPVFAPAGPVQFEIGFSTLEQPALGQLFDALSVTLALPTGEGAAVVATLDAFGLTLPNSGVGGTFGDGTVRIIEMTPGEPLLGSPASRLGYQVDVFLPPSLQGQSVQATVDFFNNGDVVPSQGYVLFRAVPEPSSLLLASSGAACLVAWSVGQVLKRRMSR